MFSLSVVWRNFGEFAVSFIADKMAQIAHIFASITDALGFDQLAARLRADVATAQQLRNEALLAVGQAEGDALADRNRRQAEIDAVTGEAFSDLERQLADEHVANTQRFRQGIDADRQALAKLQAELDALFAQANGQRQKAEDDQEAEDFQFGLDDFNQILAEGLQGARKGLDAAERQLTSLGTFNPFQAARGLVGFNPDQAQLDELRKIARSNEELVREARLGGPVFD